MWNAIKTLAVAVGVQVTVAAVDETVRVKIRNWFKGTKTEEKK